MSESQQPTDQSAKHEAIMPFRVERPIQTAATKHNQHHTGPCLLISREVGAGGGQIARHVAQRLGWRMLDKEIVDILASEYGTPPIVLDKVDEKTVGWLADLLNGWVEGHGFSQATYVHRLQRLVTIAAQQGNVVIVGRGARFILPQRDAMSVRIIAPLELRVEQVMLRQGVSATRARENIEDSDHQRNAFVKKYFHQNISDAHVHDLVVNIGQLVQDDAVELIVNSLHSWLSRRVPGVVPVEARVY